MSRGRIAEVLKKHEGELLTEWVREQTTLLGARSSEAELKAESAEFLRLLRDAAGRDTVGDPQGPAWETLREMLTGLSRTRGAQGYSPSQTASFIFSFKRPLFAKLRQEVKDAAALGEDLWEATQLLDSLGLLTTEAHQKAREEVIARQQQDMIELSTPVVQLHKGIVALPLIGTLDSSRTQTVMESLLRRIVETGSEMAIVDITGVPTVDTLTAQHLLKTVTATRLMGADCIISGVRPQIAQTLVHLGVNLGDVTTKASLSSAFALALQRTGLQITRVPRAVAPVVPVGAR